MAHPLWGAPPIHGELRKLGIEIGHTTVGKYMVRGEWPPYKVSLLKISSGLALAPGSANLSSG